MSELSLSSIANVAEIIGAITIITGLVFGCIQIRYFRIQQRDAVAINLMQTFYNRDLTQAFALLQSIPDGISLEELQARGTEYVKAAITVASAFETMGLLVFKRIAPLDLVLDLAGGVIVVMSRKLRNWQKDLRETQNQPSWGEWFEWLGDQAEKAKSGTTPAYIAHREWKP